MKKLFSALFFLIASIGIIATPHYACANVADDADLKLNDLVEFFWNGDEDDLNLCISLSKGLKFHETYTTGQFKEGQSCHFNMVLEEGHEIRLSNGALLTELTFYAEIRNTENPNKVNYEVVITGTFEEAIKRKGKTVSTEKKFTQSATLITPSIKLEIEPNVVSNAEMNFVAVIFKNAFPCKSG